MNLVLQLVAVAFLPMQAQTKLPDSVHMESNIPYDRYKQTVLDILHPAQRDKKKRPGLIMIHGGGWVGGKKEGMIPHCLRYVNMGFVVVNVEYRLADVATAPAAVTDSLKATHWVFQNARRYHIDTKRIVVMGGSAGGQLALMVAMAPKSAGLGPHSKVAAVVSFATIAELEVQLDGGQKRVYTAAWIPEQPGRLELARRMSPASYVRSGLPPTLLIHGELDQTHSQAVRLVTALREKRVDAQLITVPKGQHAFMPAEWESLFPRIRDWLRTKGLI